MAGVRPGAQALLTLRGSLTHMVWGCRFGALWVHFYPNQCWGVFAVEAGALRPAWGHKAWPCPGAPTLDKCPVQGLSEPLVHAFVLLFFAVQTAPGLLPRRSGDGECGGPCLAGDTRVARGLVHT